MYRQPSCLKSRLTSVFLFVFVLFSASLWADGTCSFTEYSVPDNLDNPPGTTGILVQHFSVNSTGSDGTFPKFFCVDVDNIGTATDSEIAAVHFYYDFEGTWSNGDETLWGTRQFGNGRASFGPDYSKMPYLPNGTQMHCYIVVDLADTVRDNLTVDTEIAPLKILVWIDDAGDPADYWTHWPALGSAGNITTAVTASKLVLSTTVNTTTRGETIADDITILATDDHGNIDEDYTGSVWFSTSDSTAVLSFDNDPVSDRYTFTAGDNGVHTFDKAGFTFNTVGSQTLTVQDGTLAVDSTDFAVQKGAYHFVLTGIGASLPAKVTAGVRFSNLGTGLTGIKMEVKDNLEDVYEPYDGHVVTFSTEEHSQNQFPDAHTFVPGTDQGTYTFSADSFRLCGVGKQRIYIKDNSDGYQGYWDVEVVPASYHTIHITAADTINAAKDFTLSLKALDAYGNIKTDVNNPISITADAVDITVPPETRLRNGEADYTVRINEPGSFTVKVTDNQTGVTGNANVQVKMVIDRSMSLALANNYITPDQSKRYVKIYVNKVSKGTSPVTVRIYDLQGRKVKEFEPKSCSPGITTMAYWYLKNQYNREVASGVYIVSIEGAGIKTERRMVVIAK